MQEFHAFELQPGKEHRLALPPMHGFHLSVVTIPHAGKGRSTLYATVDGKSFAIATLDAAQNILQAPTDLIFNEEQQVVFRVKGNAVLHCCGYQQELDAEFPDGDDSETEQNGVMMNEESDEESVDMNDPTQAPLNGHNDSDDDEDEDEEEDGMDDLEDEEMDEDDEEMDEDDEELDEDDEELDEDDEEMDDDDEDEEETNEAAAKPAKINDVPQGRPSQQQQQKQQSQSPQGRPSQQKQQSQSPQGRPSQQQQQKQQAQSPQGRPSQQKQQSQSPQGRPSQQQQQKKQVQSPQGRPSQQQQQKRGRE